MSDLTQTKTNDWSQVKPDANQKGVYIAQQWAKKRGLNWDFLAHDLKCRAVYLGKDLGGVGIAIPYFGEERKDEVVRVLQPTWGKYMLPPGGIRGLFLQHDLRREGDVILVEGITDAITLKQNFPEKIVLGFPGIAVTAKVDFFLPLKGRNVLYTADNDEPGQKSIPDLHKSLILAGANPKLFQIPKDYKDINDWHVADQKNLVEAINHNFFLLKQSDPKAILSQFLTKKATFENCLK